MRILFAIAVVFAVATTQAQNLDTTPSQPPRLRNSIEAEIAREAGQQPQNPLFLQATPANEITVNGVTYDGILVQMAKDNPLELINPTSPNGSTADNATWDLTGQRVTGWKFFSIRF